MLTQYFSTLASFHSWLVRRKMISQSASLVLWCTPKLLVVHFTHQHVHLILIVVFMNCRAVRKALSFSLTHIQTHTLTVVQLWLSSHNFPKNLAIIPVTIQTHSQWILNSLPEICSSFVFQIVLAFICISTLSSVVNPQTTSNTLVPFILYISSSILLPCQFLVVVVQ